LIPWLAENLAIEQNYSIGRNDPLTRPEVGHAFSLFQCESLYMVPGTFVRPILLIYGSPDHLKRKAELLDQIAPSRRVGCQHQRALWVE
jgi:hypothetical protein